MKATLALLTALFLVGLFGCGDSNSTADNTEAERMKDKIASLEKELQEKTKPDEAKQKADSETDDEFDALVALGVAAAAAEAERQKTTKAGKEAQRKAAEEAQQLAREKITEEAQARIDAGPVDTSTPEQLLAAYFDARSIHERLLYVADRDKNEAATREDHKDKDWDNPTTWSLISVDELSPNETKVLYSLHFPVIWEVVLKKEEGNFRFDKSTEKINLGVKIAGLREFPRVDAEIFFINPSVYNDKIVRLDGLKVVRWMQVTHANLNGVKLGNLVVKVNKKKDGQSIYRSFFVDTPRLSKLEEGDTASFIATAKILNGEQTISLIEMIEGSSPMQISLKRLEVFGKDYVGKKVLFSNVRFYDIAQSRISSFPMIQIKTDGLITTYRKSEAEKWVNFVFDESDGEACWYTLANKERWAEFLLGLKRYEKINVTGVVVELPTSSDYGIIVTGIEKTD
jgi:hypothetical protein